MKTRALLIAGFTFMAHLAYASHNNFNGPYVGIGLGATHQSSKSTDAFTADVPAILLNISMNNNGSGSAKSLLGNLNAGYSKLINPSAYLAFEARVNFDSLKSTMSMNTSAIASGVPQAQFSSNHILKKSSPSLALMFRPGILLSPRSSIYGVVGTEASKFKLSSQASYWQALGPNTASATLSGSKSSTRYGLLLGAGINSYIHNNISMGLEYNYVNYGKIGTPNPGSAITGVNGTVSVNSTMKVQTNSFIAKLTYHL